MSITVHATEPTTADSQSRSSNQTRSRSHEPENSHSHFHHSRLQAIVDPVPVESLQLTSRRHGQDSGKHAVHSPTTHTHTLPAQISNRLIRSRGITPPPALPTQTLLNQSTAPYRKYKQHSKESQGYRALNSLAGSVVEKEHVRDLPRLLLYEGGLAQVVQRHEHYHHEHHHHYHHFYQSWFFFSFFVQFSQITLTSRHWLQETSLLVCRGHMTW